MISSQESRARRSTMAAAIFLLAALLSGWVLALSQSRTQPAESRDTGLFHPDPNHIWNRVHRCLLLRVSADGKEYGEETPDPLLWQATKHLLTGESHRRALQCLDEFLRIHAEGQVRDPVRRAIFVRDLWAVFDWSASDGGNYVSERRELQVRLAEVLRRLALKPEQIAALPDNYAEAIRTKAFASDYDPAQPQRPFLPPDLFDAGGRWVCLTLRGYGPVAHQHAGAFAARSRFLVFIRLPGGRAATVAYLRSLWEFPEPLRTNGLIPNRNAPQFPAGTMVALARRMDLFDASGKLVATPITESLQIRVYGEITAAPNESNAQNGDQGFFEFRFDRRALFAGRPGLSAIRRYDTEFPIFSTQGMDAFEMPSAYPQSPILQSCRHCHGGIGIHSVQSREQIVQMNQHFAGDVLDDSHFGPIYWETEDTLAAKQGRYDWGLLNGYWKAGKP